MRYVMYGLAAAALVANGAQSNPTVMMAPAQPVQQSSSSSSSSAQQSGSQSGSQSASQSSSSSGDMVTTTAIPAVPNAQATTVAPLPTATVMTTTAIPAVPNAQATTVAPLPTATADVATSLPMASTAAPGSTTSAPAATTPAPGASSSSGANNGIGDDNANVNTNTNPNQNQVSSNTNIYTLFSNVATVVGTNWFLNVPGTVQDWDLTPANRYGPAYGPGTAVWPTASLAPQNWWQWGQRYSWSFLPWTAGNNFQFTDAVRNCVLQTIEKQVQLYDGRLTPGWLVPINGSNATLIATDVAYGTLTAVPHYNWLSWVLPWGAPNSIVSSEPFVAPFLNILQNPNLYATFQNTCGLPPSNYTVINKKIQYQSNSWAATQGSNVQMTDPVFGSAPSLMSPVQLLALPLISLAALFRA